jgi:photosystem II stability/assembly factor-like uncharacterized protein
MPGDFTWRRNVLVGVLAAAVTAGALAARPDGVATSRAPSGAGASLGQRGGGGAMPQNVAIDPLRFHYMGPAPAGRIAAVVGIPGDPSTYYLGSASGGIWKSTDGASTFVPIFDGQPVAAIGTLALAPSDPNIVWAGTGESWVIRYSDVTGDGVYRSTDAGKTWTHLGLAETGRIARIVVHPTNPNIVFVCAVGRATGPQQERGVYRTTDGGATWERVLFVNPDTGCSGLSMDAADPNTLVAGTWQIVARTWGEFSGTWPGYTGEPGSGVYISHDGGTKWTKITAGLPRPPVGKIDVAIAPSNSKRIYALIQTPDQGSLWRSDDGGVSFKVVSWDRSLIGRAGYYIRIAVNPQNPDEILVSSSGFHRSINGGVLFEGRGGGAPGGAGGAGGAGPILTTGRGQSASCGDCHDIWVDPKNPTRYALTDDGGAAISTGQGTTINVQIPNGQMYHVATDNRVPYWIYSNRQDDGTMRGPSSVPEQTGRGVMDTGWPAMPPPAPGGRGGGGGGGGGRGGGNALTWEPGIGGCESGFTIPDVTDPNIVWATCYGNKLTRYDARTKTAHSVEPWMISLDSAPNDAKYRCHWTAPLAIDPFDHNTVYYGCQLILKTSNEGHSWTEFSPDLSTKDPSRIVSNGGLVGDNLGQWDGEVVWAIAPSPIQRGLIWAGTNDGKLWYTKDGTAATPTWIDVTKNLTGLPVWGTFTEISPSSFDAGTAYVSVDVHLMDNRKPFVYKTTDFGATWTNVTGDLPASHPLDYILSVAENPNKKGMLFAGSGHGFYYSMNDGAHWTQFKDGLPPAPVSWITIQKTFHDVAISTYGRGLFILPDITILEQTGQPVAPPTTQLYAPRPVIRLARSVYQQPGHAHFMFSLGSAPAGPITMDILDAAGKVIRTQPLTGHQGLNGASWNLQYEPPTLVALKTTPPENPHIWDEARFQGTDTRRITHWGITQGTGVPLAAPGKYQVRLTIDGKAYTQPFEVVKDPAILASDADLVASTQMQVRIRDDITATSEMTNRMEVSRKQIEDLLKANQGKDELEKPLLDLNKRILDVELRLVTKSEMLSDDKYFPEAYKVYMNLIWLSGGVGQGASDEAGGVDYRPTDTQLKVVALLEQELAAAKLAFTTITDKDIPAFNQAMTGKLPTIK